MIKFSTKSKKHMGKIGEIKGSKIAKLEIYQLPMLISCLFSSKTINQKINRERFTSKYQPPQVSDDNQINEYGNSQLRNSIKAKLFIFKTHVPKPVHESPGHNVRIEPPY